MTSSTPLRSSPIVVHRGEWPAADSLEQIAALAGRWLTDGGDHPNRLQRPAAGSAASRALRKLCAIGMFPTRWQPAMHRGRIEQYAALTGLSPLDLLPQLETVPGVQVVACRARWPWQPRVDIPPVLFSGGRPALIPFTQHMSRSQLGEQFPWCSPGARADVRRAQQVTVFYPGGGSGDRLWLTLVGALRVESPS